MGYKRKSRRSLASVASITREASLRCHNCDLDQEARIGELGLDAGAAGDAAEIFSRLYLGESAA